MKSHVFKRNVSFNFFDAIVITETWLLDGLYDSEYVDSRYIVYRRDIDYAATGQRYGGGVVIAV
jgi:hypothetical protein